MNALLLAAALSQSGQTPFEIDLTSSQQVTRRENADVDTLGAKLAREPGSWVELLRGKKGFGHLTGIFVLGKRIFAIDSPTPAGTAGGDVYMLDPATLKPTKVFSVQDEGAMYVREHEGQYFIPGPDSTESWERGNFYRSTGGKEWSKVRTVPNAVNVWDLCFWKGRLYVSTGSVKNNQGYAAVLESSDMGRSWKEVVSAYPPDRKTQFARSYALIPLGDTLYASFTVSDNDPKKPGPLPDHDFFRFDGKKWTAEKLFPEPPRLPYFGLKHKEIGPISLIGYRGGASALTKDRVLELGGLQNLTVFDFARSGVDHLYAVATDPGDRRSAVYRTSYGRLAAGQALFERSHLLPEGEEGISIASHNGRLLVGTKGEVGRILTEGYYNEAAVITRTVRIRSNGHALLEWEGIQPEGTSMQFQVHVARSQRELERMTDWAQTLDAPAPPQIRLTGLPRGDAYLQFRVVLRTSSPLITPILKKLSISTP